ncbi:MAG: hypothetical protein ACTHU0_26495 [Kofleriaceae bacterium]
MIDRRLALALALAAGCGDNIPAIELADLHAESVAARCERLVRCGLLADLDVCTAYFRVPDEAGLYAAIAAGKIRYDAASAQACQDALARLDCDETSRDARTTPEPCTRMLEGTIETGDECVFDAECRSGACNAPEVCPFDTCCGGTCIPSAFAAPGEPCEADRDCVSEHFCGPDRTCHGLSTPGQSCRRDAHCDHGLACIGATELQEGTCRKLPAIGESCPYLRCAELGATCNAAQRCVPVGLPGAPCVADSDCSPFTLCGTSGTCVDVPGRGMPCDFRCAGEAWCSEGTCVAPLENTTPCTADDQCASQYCRGGALFESCADRPACF